MTLRTDKWVFLNPETYVEEEVAAALERIITEYGNSLNLDNGLSSLAYGEREETKKYFETVVDQVAYFTEDHKKIRNFIIDWYSAHKTKISKARKITELNLLSSEELSEFILSLGFPFPANIPNKNHRIAFLKELINNYNKKGTPSVLGKILALYGLRNILISEWWIRYDSRREDPFFARSNVIYSTMNKDDINNPILETTKSYGDFIKDSPHWQITLDELTELFNNPENKISLPSITNAISIEAYTNIADMQIATAIFQRKVEETYDFWLRYTLIPETGLTTTPIYTTVTNNPPTDYATYSSDPYYLVGDSPTGDWIGHPKEIAYYSQDDLQWMFVNPSNGDTILVKDDSGSLVEKGRLLMCNRKLSTDPIKWDVYKLRKDATLTAYNADKTIETSFVYNDIDVIDLSGVLPSNKLLNRDENIYRYIPLNGFTSLYSVFEIMLALSYLHDGDYILDSNEYHLYYNGEYEPLDDGFLQGDDDTVPNIRDDVDTLHNDGAGNFYSVIEKEYKNLVYDRDQVNGGGKSYRHTYNFGNTPYTLRNARMETFNSNWRNPNDYTIDHNLYVQTHAETFLKAVNPTFLEEINTMLLATNKDLLIENILVDLESYAYSMMNLENASFAYVMKGGEFFSQKLIPVVNFFKPFRVRLLDFTTKFLVDNPLHDSLLCDERMYNTITHYAIEKPFPRNLETDTLMHQPDEDGGPILDYLFDHGLATEDLDQITIYQTIDEPNYSTYDSDGKKALLDINFNDYFTIKVYDGDDNLEYDYRVDDEEVYQYDVVTGEITGIIEPVDE